ncbi:MAG: type II toxin-antitoxin system VapC family toxin [Deltaproteobacteria bacterium]|nr:type II toxin-antitoxin system VapC family toxin [Deltaproteobacteria bacterium]
MNTYVDTGFLCSLYAPDAHTRRVVARMRRQRLPLPFTWLHQIELRNALRLRVFRREITAAQREASLNMMLADLGSGVLVVAAPALAEVTTEAERLGAVHSEKLGTRSLDILHVASAVVLGSTSFLTFDRRQAALARASGLSVPAISS